MLQWHPFTKVFAIVGFAVIATLLWSENFVKISKIEHESLAIVDRLRSIPPTQSLNVTEKSMKKEFLSSIENFNTIISRPLFSPNRQALPIISYDQTMDIHEQNIIFFGTAEKNNQITALIFDGYQVQNASKGDKISGWTVSAIYPRTLILELDGKITSYSIFD